MEYLVAAFLIAYLIGSIPFGLILTKIFLKKDIRNEGSGNIGATNVLRMGSKKLAAATVVLDAFKAILPVVLISEHYRFGTVYFSAKYPHEIEFVAILVGSAAILGHCFPIWLKFKGGKGVATTFGALLAAVPFAGLAAAAAWLLTAFVFKMSSLAALVAVGIAPIVTFFVYGAVPAVVCLLITLLVWLRHKDNIKRLMKGEEPKIGDK